MSLKIATRRFAMEDQLRFAAWSGDYNPIHMDPVAARRIAAGAPVVHGVHLLLWGIDAIAATRPSWVAISRLAADFKTYLTVDEIAEVALVSANDARLEFHILARGETVATRVVLNFGRLQDRPLDCPDLPDAIFASRAAADIDLDALSDLQGRTPFAQEAHALDFPGAKNLLGSGRLKALGAFSRLIGMECPGLHSIFVGSKLAPCVDDNSQAVGFRVDKFRPELRYVDEMVWGSGWIGHLLARIRQKPTTQPHVRRLAERVASDAFSGQTALVLGGSRGIGEVAAKLIAAGGGRVIVTFAKGAEDADRVVDEIRAWGGAADAARFDVTQPSAEQISTLPQINLMLYYASPMIAGRLGPRFSWTRFEEFLSYYVRGFEDVCQALLARGGKLAALYPSTVFVEERPQGLTEYAMAKAAGEQLCRDLNAAIPDLRVIVDRLPPLATDQNPDVAETGDIANAVLPGLLRLIG